MYIAKIADDCGLVSKIDGKGRVVAKYNVALPDSCSCRAGAAGKKCKHISMFHLLTSTTPFSQATAFHLVEELKQVHLNHGCSEFLHYDTVKAGDKVLGVKVGCFFYLDNPADEAFSWTFKAKYKGLWGHFTYVFDQPESTAEGDTEAREVRKEAPRHKRRARLRKVYNALRGSKSST